MVPDRQQKHLKSLKNGTVEVGRGLFCDVEQSIMGENRSVCRESVGYRVCLSATSKARQLIILDFVGLIPSYSKQ